MALFDLLGRSWALGVIWQLQNGPATFRKLQAKCDGVSPTTLNKRIKELTLARLIVKTMDGYDLTMEGSELVSKIKPLKLWSRAWAQKLNDGKAPDTTDNPKNDSK